MSPRNPLFIEWTTSAWEDLDGIAEYLLSEGVFLDVVETFLTRIFKAPEHLLATLPGAGKPGRVPGTREWRVKDTTYALIYDVYNGKIRILRAMHDSRQFPEQ